MKRPLFLFLVVIAAARLAFAQSGPVITSQIPDLTVYGGAPPATTDLDKQHFTVFGRLADYSLPIMDALAAIPVPSPAPFGPPVDHWPLFNFEQGATFVRPDQIPLVNVVTAMPTVFKSFTVTSDHPEIAAPVIQARNLSIQTSAGQLGTAVLTVVANSFNGGSVSQHFTVNV